MKRRYPQLVPLLCLAALLAVGCRKPSEARQFRDLVKKVQAGESTEIDCGKRMSIADDQLKELTAASGMEKLDTLILDDTKVTDDGIKALPWLPGLRMFSASNTQITDAGLAHLPKVGNLEHLRLDQARITDLGLQTIGKMKSLRKLSLWRCAVTDQGLLHLQHLSNLEHLSLDETQVTGPGVRQHLAEMSSLRYLSVWKTKVGPADAQALQARNPELKVNR